MKSVRVLLALGNDPRKNGFGLLKTVPALCNPHYPKGPEAAALGFRRNNGKEAEANIVY